MQYLRGIAHNFNLQVKNLYIIKLLYAYIMGMFCPGIFLYGYVLSGYVFPGIFSTGMFFRVCYFLDPFENMTIQSPLHAKLLSTLCTRVRLSVRVR